MTREDAPSRTIIGAAIEVHSVLGGPGLLEGIYEQALVVELELQGLQVGQQVPLPVRYKGTLLRSKLRLDLLVEGLVIVECKAITELPPVAKRQVLTYLRLLGLRLGLLVNFGKPLLRDGIYRVVNRL